MTVPAMAAALVRQSARGCAQAAVADLRRDDAELIEQALPAAGLSPLADVEVRLLQLAEAVAFAVPELYGDAARWYAIAFAHRDVPASYLLRSFAAMQTVLRRELPTASLVEVEPVLAAALLAAGEVPQLPPSPLAAAGPHVDRARRFLLATLEGRGDDALDLVRAALGEGLGVEVLHDEVLVPVQREIGRMWLLGEAPIADEHFTSQIVARALDCLADRLPRPAGDAPHALCFAVAGNLHDLGSRIVAQRLQLAGFRVSSLGADFPASDLAWAVAARSYDLLAVSATMLLHLGAAAAVVAERDRRLGGRPPILLGGPPFVRVPDLHRRLGANAGVGDAAAAVAAARALLPDAQRRRIR